MGDIYVLYGEAHSGKSSTIKEVYKILSLKYPNCIDKKSISDPNEYDIKVIMHNKYFVRDIEKTFVRRNDIIEKIGILSHDNNSIRASLDYFAEHECKIIFCAERVQSEIFNQLVKSNRQKRNSIIKNTEVGQWVKSNLSSLNFPYPYKMTHFIQQGNTHSKNRMQAQEIIEKARL